MIHLVMTIIFIFVLIGGLTLEESLQTDRAVACYEKTKDKNCFPELKEGEK